MLSVRLHAFVRVTPTVVLPACNSFSDSIIQHQEIASAIMAMLKGILLGTTAALLTVLPVTISDVSAVFVTSNLLTIVISRHTIASAARITSSIVIGVCVYPKQVHLSTMKMLPLKHVSPALLTAPVQHRVASLVKALHKESKQLILWVETSVPASRL